MMEPASSSSSSSSCASSSSSLSSSDEKDNVGPLQDEKKQKELKEFDDLPSDDSVSLSSSSDDDDDDDDDNDDSDGTNGTDDDHEDEDVNVNDENEEDVPLSERLYKQRHEKGSSSAVRRVKAEKTKKALALASQRLKQMRSSSNNKQKEEEEEETKEKKKKKKSKHAPTEASSLRRDYYSKTNLSSKNINSSGVGVEIGANTYKPRDPRMNDELSGHFDVHDFERRFAFLEQVQDDEIEELKKRIAVKKMSGRKGQKQRKKLRAKSSSAAAGAGAGWTTLEEDEQELKRLLQERSTRHKSQIQRAARQSIKKKLRENVAQGKQGAYHPKKREWKQMELEAKFDELRKRGGDRAVEEALKKRRKKNRERDHRFMPSTASSSS